MQNGSRNVKGPISKFLQDRIDEGDFPSAVYLVAEKGEILMQDALGFAVVEPEKIEARIDTIYDVASLTKVLVTGLLIANMVDSGDLGIDDVVSDHLESAKDSAVGQLTIKSLLTHTTGLPAWRPFYLLADKPTEIENLIVQTPLTLAPDVVYSDLNFLLLASVICSVRENAIDIEAKRSIIESLGLLDTCFAPDKGLRRRIAASEKGNAFEWQTCVDQGYLIDHTLEAKNPVAFAPGSDMFRTDVIWGEVHDGNAYFMGGVAGHAGLFSTAEEVFKVAQQFLPNYTQLLKPAACKLFRANFTPGMSEDRSFAFQLASTKDSTAGTKMSPESFGHNGFTGTSLWIDPKKERVFVLLTNRTHDHSLPFTNINSVRRRFHDIAVEWLDKK